jgi:hypothetical protein
MAADRLELGLGALQAGGNGTGEVRIEFPADFAVDQVISASSELN